MEDFPSRTPRFMRSGGPIFDKLSLECNKNQLRYSGKWFERGSLVSPIRSRLEGSKWNNPK